MEYSNELKVGAALIVAALVFFAGLRFFQDLPLIQDSYTLRASFEDASGLVEGNAVNMRGVNIGTVTGVRLDQAQEVVRVEFRVDQDVRIPEGSHARVTGISGVSGVRLAIQPGPPDNPPLTSGATLEPPPQGTILDRLSDQAPALATKADSVLTGANTTIQALSTQFGDSQSDLRQTLQATRNTMESVESITEAERQNIRSLIQNLQAISEDLEGVSGTRSDSLKVVIDRLNRSLARLERSMASFENTTKSLDAITTKLDNGTGTAGRLLNDPSLYNRLDSAAARTNGLLRDLKENPGRYLDDMTLVKVF